jgi:hypothetical protein
MPETISDPDTRSVDIFMEQVIQGVRRQEARAREPFCYTIDATAGFTGLPVRLLRRLCRAGMIQAVKHTGWWLLHRDEFMRLLDPASTMQWRTNQDRQQIFLDYLQRLAALLHPVEADCIIQVLLKDLRRAVQARREGYGYDDAEGHAWHRAEWRVRYGVVDPAQVEDALVLLRNIVSLGMSVFERIGWDQDETAALVAELRDQADIEVWL